MNKKRIFLLVILFLGVIVLPFIDVKGDVIDVVIIEPDNTVYAYDDSTATFQIRMYYEGATSTSWAFKFDSEGSYQEGTTHTKITSRTYVGSGSYDIGIDIDAFSVGKHDFYVRVRDVYTGTYFYDSAVFYRDSEAPAENVPLQITWESPSYDLLTVDVSTSSSYTTTAHVRDPEGIINWVKLYINGELNKTWTSPSNDRDFSYTFDVSEGFYSLQFSAYDGSNTATSSEMTIQCVNEDSPTNELEIIQPTKRAFSINPSWKISTADNDSLSQFYYEWENNTAGDSRTTTYPANSLPSASGWTANDETGGSSVSSGKLEIKEGDNWQISDPDNLDMTAGVTVRYSLKGDYDTHESGFYYYLGDGTYGIKILHLWNPSSPDTVYTRFYYQSGSYTGNDLTIASEDYEDYWARIKYNTSDSKMYFALWCDDTLKHTYSHSVSWSDDEVEFGGNMGGGNEVFLDFFDFDVSGAYTNDSPDWGTLIGAGGYWDSTCIIYSGDDTNTSRTDSFTMTWGTTAWEDFSQGEIEIMFTVEDSSSRTYTYNYTITKDTLSPAVNIGGLSSGGEYTISSIPALKIICDWGANENDSNSIIVEVDYHLASSYARWEWTDTQDYSTRDNDFPTAGTKIVETVGNHSVRVTIIDVAGNSDSESFYFYVYSEKEVQFSFTSSYDSSSVPVSKYLKILIDGFLYEESSVSVRYKESFELEVTDKFDNQLYYATDYAYSESISLELDMRTITLNNAQSYVVGYEIIQDTSAGLLEGSISASGSTTIYLYDGTYTVIADTYQESIDGDWHYEATATEFTTSSSTTEVDIGLSLVENPNYLITIESTLEKEWFTWFLGFIIANIILQLGSYYFISQKNDSVKLLAEKNKEMIEALGENIKIIRRRSRDEKNVRSL